MFRGAAVLLTAVLGACSGRSSQNDSGPGGAAGTSNASAGGALTTAGSSAAMAGTSAAMAGSSTTSGGNETAGSSGASMSGSSGAATAGSPAGGAGGAGGEAGAPSGEGGDGTSLECPSGCSAGSEPFCQEGGVTWVCFGPGPIDDAALRDGGCTDLATQVPRYCCPASFRPDCQ